MNPILIVIFGTAVLGFAEAFSNRQLKKHKAITGVGLMLVGSTVNIVLTLIWNIAFGIPFTSLTLRSWILVIVLTVIYYAAGKLYYSSYKTEHASTITVLMMLSIVVSTIFGQIVFHEDISMFQWLGIVIVLIAVLRINIGKFSKDSFKEILKLNRAKKIAILGSCLYGLGFSIAKLVVQDINPHYYQFLDVAVGLPFYFILDYKEVTTQIRALSKNKTFWAFAPIILLYFFYNKCKYLAFSKGIALPVADAVDNTVVFIILGVEYFILRIKQDNYLEKLLLSLMAFVGVVLIGM